MNTTMQRDVPKANLDLGEFNNCEHLFVQIEPGKYQTISCRLPNGKFVTFAFVPGQGEEIECCDIHSTIGRRWTDKKTLGGVHFQMEMIGFSAGKPDSFDTRKVSRPTTLATLLLGDSHYPIVHPVKHVE